MATSDFEATTSADAIKAQWWIEIAGIRRRYGIISPSWAPSEDTGTNRIVREYMNDLPEISGQYIEPLNGKTVPHKFSVRIVDVDDELTELFGIADDSGNKTTLASAMTATTTTMTVDDASVFSFPCDLFINQECCRAASTAGNNISVTRGAYGSDAVAHALTDPQGNTYEVEVRDKPFTMHNRKVTLCENRDGLVEADTIKISGFLDSWSEDAGVYTLHCSGFLKLVDKTIGLTLAKSPLFGPLWGGLSRAPEPGSYASMSAIRLVDGTEAAKFLDPSTWGCGGYVKIDDEIVRYITISGQSLYLVDYNANQNDLTHYEVIGNRGMFSVDCLGDDGWRRDHYNHFEMSSLFPYFMDWHSYTPGKMVTQVIHSEFFGSVANGTHVGEVILQFLTSIDGDGTNGTYDTLPPGWGLGIDTDYVDTTGILEETRRGSISSIDLAPFCITEPINLREWLEENVLRPCHLFLVETEEGKISIRRLYDKTEAEVYGNATAITEDDLPELPSVDNNNPPIGSISFSFNWAPGEDEYYGKVNVYLSDSNARYNGIARNYDFELKTCYDNRYTRSSAIVTGAEGGNLPEMLLAYMRPIWANYAVNPCPVVTFEVPYNMYIYVQAGKVIKLTSSTLPNQKNSSRTMTQEYFQVIEATPDPGSSSVEVVAWQIGVHDKNYRMYAPAAKVGSYSASGPGGYPTIYCYNSTFADGYTYTYDTEAFTGDGATDIFLLTSTYQPISGAGSPERCDVVGVNSASGNCYVQVYPAPTDPPGNGDYIVLASYNYASTQQKAKWAFMADSGETLGSASDVTHRRSR